MRKVFVIAFSGLLSLGALNLSSCASLHTPGSYHPKLYKTGGKARGVVAMLPVYYRAGKSTAALPWSLQTEFSEEISKRFLSSEKLLLIKHNASPQLISQFYAPQVASLPITIIGQFLPAEFIVATELLEQKSTQDAFGNDSLSVSVRVRLFDVRRNKISLIYQEIIEANQPAISVISDYHRCRWQTKHFESTPMGLMHQRLFREIVARVEGYVCANYS